MIEVRRAAIPADYASAWQLISEMGRWDASECEARGIQAAETLAAFYVGDGTTLEAALTRPMAGLFLARDSGADIGLVAYAPLGPRVAELQKLWVTPTARGAGAARALMSAAFEALRSEPYDAVRLETAAFMEGAIRLYEAYGFVRCAPFRQSPPSLGDLPVFMERGLGPDGQGPSGRATVAE